MIVLKLIATQLVKVMQI